MASNSEPDAEALHTGDDPLLDAIGDARGAIETADDCLDGGDVDTAVDQLNGAIESLAAADALAVNLRAKLSAAEQVKAQAEATLALARKRFVGGGDLVADIDDLLLSEHNLRELVLTLIEALNQAADRLETLGEGEEFQKLAKEWADEARAALKKASEGR